MQQRVADAHFNQSVLKPAIHIDQPEARVQDGAAIQAAVARSDHPLAGCEVRYWVGAEWQVLEQAYDLPDVYVSYLEITAQGDCHIPIRCPCHDLYWLYVLAGSIGIAHIGHPRLLLVTAAGQYRLSYLPPARYVCRFAAGMHRVFYAVHKPRALFREHSRELAGGIAAVEAVKARLGHPAVSDRLPMADGSLAAISRFLRAPGGSYLRRMLAVYTLTISLIFLTRESLLRISAQKRSGAEWAERMRVYIDECVAQGEPVDTAQVAAHFRLSRSYAKSVFSTHMHVYPGAYIRACKLEQARRMIEAGDRPTQVARYIGWTYGHFSKAFKARYGVSPKNYGKP